MEGLVVSLDQIQYFILVFVRVMTIFSLLPIFNSPNVPFQVKISVSLLISVALFSSNPVLHTLHLSYSLSVPLLALLVIKEVMIGLAIGYVGSFLFTAVQFAGRLVDTEMGFGFVELVDPFSDEPVTSLGQLQVIIFTILFLMFNGHYFLLLSIQKSFELVPLAAASFAEGPMSEHVISMIGAVFVTSFKLAAPIYITLILTEVSMGVVARTVPQINIFFVGLPLKLIVGMSTAVLVLPMLANLFQRFVGVLIQDIWKMLYLMA